MVRTWRRAVCCSPPSPCGPDSHGVRVRQREGRTELRDGPFTEAKEMVGGFFLVDCASREEAVALASECPAARWAAVEVREVAPCHVR